MCQRICRDMRWMCCRSVWETFTRVSPLPLSPPYTLQIRRKLKNNEKSQDFSHGLVLLDSQKRMKKDGIANQELLEQDLDMGHCLPIKRQILSTCHVPAQLCKTCARGSPERFQNNLGKTCAGTPNVGRDCAKSVRGAPPQFSQNIMPDIPQSENAATKFYESSGSQDKKLGENWANFIFLLCRTTHQISPKNASQFITPCLVAEILKVSSPQASGASGPQQNFLGSF